MHKRSSPRYDRVPTSSYLHSRLYPQVAITNKLDTVAHRLSHTCPSETMSLGAFCPCPMGGSATDKKRLVEMSPFKTAGSDSDKEGAEEAPTSMADRAKGWLSTIAAPITKMKEDYDKDCERSRRLEALKEGTTMQLIDGKGERTAVRAAVTSDGAMITWSGPGQSGVMALAAIREVKPVLQSGFFRSGGPVPCQFCLVADDQTVRFEASTDDVKDQWMSTVEEAAQAAAEAKVGRKMASQAKRRLGLEERKRENERRKAEIMKTCATGGVRTNRMLCRPCMDTVIHMEGSLTSASTSRGADETYRRRNDEPFVMASPRERSEANSGVRALGW